MTIANPTTTDVTYDLSVQGVPAAWVQIPAQELVPAGGSVTVPLTLTADPFAPASSYDFVVSATVDGVIGSVDGTLVLAGAAVLPPTDPDSHGVVVSLTPTRHGRPGERSTVYTVQLTNTGSTDDTFTLVRRGIAGRRDGFLQLKPPSTCRRA